MPSAKAGDIDLFIVPGLAFDRKGNRLGQGKGYYDRFLQRMNPRSNQVGNYRYHTPTLVAVGLQCQLVDEVPTQPTDHPMDLIVVPSEVISVSREYYN
jgi:5-formyltetrahydrofolate cyclo-ligase